ncbi:hypothetical protein CDAR_179531 [Caerostris darwini]|uniref:Uncharacterized protein n=1 Tax=Caerostris darwini TaxID=1538125 RepID=A0AAV4P2G4_9ARAC|nr:hypothetical protein CDAR_179531 [Caerostris darwini]
MQGSNSNETPHQTKHTLMASTPENGWTSTSVSSGNIPDDPLMQISIGNERKTSFGLLITEFVPKTSDGTERLP